MLYAIDNLLFCEDGYFRRMPKSNRLIYRAYRPNGKVIFRGKAWRVPRLLAWVKATPYQRARFDCYDSHHRNMNHSDNRMVNIELLTVAQHRKVHN